MRLIVVLFILSIFLTNTVSYAADVADEEFVRIQELLNKLGAKLKDLKAENTTLKQRLFALEQSSPTTAIPTGAVALAIPTGAVVAFDRATGCPTGWIQFSPAADRFVIGVGDKYELPYVGGEPKYQLGGEEVVTLKVLEMPKHTHFLRYTDDVIREQDYAVPRTARFTIGTDDFKIEVTGKGQAHENMPPYIALYFCKKEAS